MTNQNNAAHDLRTSAGGRAYVAEYFATQLRRHDFARYIENTLAADFACALAQHLSKLRAPVADEQRLDTLADPALQKLFGEAITGALGFGAQGMNPPPSGHWLEPFWQMGRADAALASAPVAGEAVYTLRVRGSIQAWAPTAAAFSLPDGEHQLFLSPAAPQASEAVHKEALYLLREARALLPMFATAEAIGDWSEKVNRFAAGDVIDIPPQADKDGGDCAKGAGDEHERLAFEAWAATEVPAHKLGRAPWPYEDQYNWVSMDYAWSMWRKIRAALSAQPAKEPANPNPSAAGNPGAAGVSDSSKTGAAQDGDRHA